MKRIISLLLVLIVSLLMAVTALAANKSPGHDSGETYVAPEKEPYADRVIDVENANGDITINARLDLDNMSPYKIDLGSTRVLGADTTGIRDAGGMRCFLVVTPYDFRSTIISKESINESDYMHAEILDGDAIDKLEAKLREMAAGRPIGSKEVIAGTVFDVTFYEENLVNHNVWESDNHGTVTLLLGSDVLEHFVALIHYIDGEWSIVENCRVVGSDSINFYIDHFSPFAIVVDTESSKTPGVISPKTGDPGFPAGALTAMIICLLGAGGGILMIKRWKLNEN